MTLYVCMYVRIIHQCSCDRRSIPMGLNIRKYIIGNLTNLEVWQIYTLKVCNVDMQCILCSVYCTIQNSCEEMIDYRLMNMWNWTCGHYSIEWKCIMVVMNLKTRHVHATPTDSAHLWGEKLTYKCFILWECLAKLSLMVVALVMVRSRSLSK